MRKNYFPSVKGCPPPLGIRVERKVRFEETDPLGIVWHGRYASFFEDARTAPERNTVSATRISKRTKSTPRSGSCIRIFLFP